eukprot:GHVU01106376.1.p1 GENE.GHVU01106376.1~~GHVU01106376.1.p1  ORF type:complete len:146 (-),score=12.05 GHVU01106376.1:141-578(-)
MSESTTQGNMQVSSSNWNTGMQTPHLQEGLQARVSNVYIQLLSPVLLIALVCVHCMWLLWSQLYAPGLRDPRYSLFEDQLLRQVGYGAISSPMGVPSSGQVSLFTPMQGAAAAASPGHLITQPFTANGAGSVLESTLPPKEKNDP